MNEQVDFERNKPLPYEQLLDNARNETGLFDLDDRFIGPFQRLIKSAEDDVVFTPLGKMSFEAEMHRTLVNRLRFEDDLKKNPEILNEDVSDPIIILGLPRTGSSKLHRMLSAAPDVQKLYLWRLLNPAPFPDADLSGPDPRIEAARETSRMMLEIAPDMVAAHPMMADEVDEESHLDGISAESFIPCLYTPVESYYQWVKDRNIVRPGEDMVNLIKYLQWQDGGKRGRPWILKSPFHIGHLDSILEVFPKATLIHLHRDVCDIIPSFCRLVECSWRIKTDHVDLNALGQMILEVWGGLMDRCLEYRKNRADDLNILDFSYREVNESSLPLTRKIFHQAGLEYTKECEKTMSKWLTENPQGRYGKNIYSMERYGLTKAMIENRFKDYLDSFSQFVD
jgi:hypothetical protein